MAPVRFVVFALLVAAVVVSAEDECIGTDIEIVEPPKLKLYGNRFSTCTTRVYLALKEKGADFQFIHIDFQNLKTPEYLEKQPFGLVPYIDDDGFILYESRAIVEYIENKYKNQGTSLVPFDDLKSLALLRQWYLVELEEYNPAASGLASELIFRPRRGVATDEKRVAEYKDQLNKVSWDQKQTNLMNYNQQALNVLETQLSKHDYIAGDSFSIVDVNILPYTAKLFDTNNGDLITSRPYVNAWWQRVTSRESWKKSLTELPTL